MEDIIIGMGEIGSALYEYFNNEKKIECDGFDLDESKCRKKHEFYNQRYETAHICFPYSINFQNQVKHYFKKYSPNYIIIHSTVEPKTTKSLQQVISIPIIYSPVRGVHTRLIQDLMRYPKWYACEKEIENFYFAQYFNKVIRKTSTEILERTKILCDTTYLGWLVAYRKMVDNAGEVYWDFAQEIHNVLGNRPVMYNDKKLIGGHCVKENLLLIDNLELKVLMKNIIGTAK